MFEPVAGDTDDDGDAELTDFLELLRCLTAGRVTTPFACDAFDLDHDRDVDLADIVAFQNAFTGPHP